VTAERFIRGAIFVFLLIGLCTISGWASYQYIGDFILKVASVALSWGIILLVLYIVFRKLDWQWWS